MGTLSLRGEWLILTLWMRRLSLRGLGSIRCCRTRPQTCSVLGRLGDTGLSSWTHMVPSAQILSLFVEVPAQELFYLFIFMVTYP